MSAVGYFVTGTDTGVGKTRDRLRRCAWRWWPRANAWPP